MTDLSGEQKWSLQGQLVGQWAAELRSTWRKARQEGATRRYIVELIEVTAIDRNGEEVLKEIMSQGVGFIASAHRGTLFLDEIGDLPLDLQPLID